MTGNRKSVYFREGSVEMHFWGVIFSHVLVSWRAEMSHVHPCYTILAELRTSVSIPVVVRQFKYLISTWMYVGVYWVGLCKCVVALHYSSACTAWIRLILLSPTVAVCGWIIIQVINLMPPPMMTSRYHTMSQGSGAVLVSAWLWDYSINIQHAFRVGPPLKLQSCRSQGFT